MSRRLRRRINPQAQARARESQSIEASIARLAERRARPSKPDKRPGTVEIEDGVAYVYDADGALRMMMPEAAYFDLKAGGGNV